MLKEKTKDMEFVIKTIQILGEIDSFLALKIMKDLFDTVNEFIKIKILKNMQSISNPDYGFLMPIVKKGNATLKKEALVILRKDPHMLKEAAILMLSIPTPFGMNRERIIENMRIIDELETKDAADYLISLKKRRFFWNKAIRRKAADILRKWNVK